MAEQADGTSSGMVYGVTGMINENNQDNGTASIIAAAKHVAMRVVDGSRRISAFQPVQSVQQVRQVQSARQVQLIQPAQPVQPLQALHPGQPSQSVIGSAGNVDTSIGTSGMARSIGTFNPVPAAAAAQVMASYPSLVAPHALNITQNAHHGVSMCLPAAVAVSTGIPGSLTPSATNIAKLNPEASTIDDRNALHPKKKRLCRFLGCIRVIKSQGHCQRHGAKAKRCKVDGCDKQAQGTHDGMCKRHWKAVNFPDAPTNKTGEAGQPIEPEGESVYDNVLPLSISYRPSSPIKPRGAGTNEQQSNNSHKEDSLLILQPLPLQPVKNDPMDPPSPPEGANVMPLINFLKGASKEPGWHRNVERRARGISPITSLSVQFEPWERQLALVEILLLSGGTPYANFKDLAHAWGREKGFHRAIPWGHKRISNGNR